jgi:hypothetical protein
MPRLCRCSAATDLPAAVQVKALEVAAAARQAEEARAQERALRQQRQKQQAAAAGGASAAGGRPETAKSECRQHFSCKQTCCIMHNPLAACLCSAPQSRKQHKAGRLLQDCAATGSCSRFCCLQVHMLCWQLEVLHLMLHQQALLRSPRWQPRSRQ